MKRAASGAKNSRSNGTSRSAVPARRWVICVSAVSYDSREPIARTLSSFAINLNNNPTFAGIVSQMRGERIEVAISATAANQPGKLTGTIVGVEKQKVTAGAATVEIEVLNMWCAEGMRAVKMTDVIIRDAMVPENHSQNQASAAEPGQQPGSG